MIILGIMGLKKLQLYIVFSAEPCVQDLFFFCYYLESKIKKVMAILIRMVNAYIQNKQVNIPFATNVVTLSYIIIEFLPENARQKMFTFVLKKM